jgi:hypothetical protein
VAAVQWWSSQWDDFHTELTQLIDANDDQVVHVVRNQGRGKLSGVEVAEEVAFLTTIRDGKATRIEMFRSVSEALEAPGCGSRRCRRRMCRCPGPSRPPKMDRKIALGGRAVSCWQLADPYTASSQMEIGQQVAVHTSSDSGDGFSLPHLFTDVPAGMRTFQLHCFEETGNLRISFSRIVAARLSG